jgi:hypothetical protein
VKEGTPKQIEVEKKNIQRPSTSPKKHNHSTNSPMASNVYSKQSIDSPTTRANSLTDGGQQ